LLLQPSEFEDGEITEFSVKSAKKKVVTTSTNTIDYFDNLLNTFNGVITEDSVA